MELMKLFDTENGCDYSKWHSVVKKIYEEPDLLILRAMLEWWTKGFEDKDGNFISDFQEKFYPRLWELYLFKVFSDWGCVFDFSKNRPDLHFVFPHRIYMEATIANNKFGSKPIDAATVNDQLSLLMPPFHIDNYNEFINESICRLSNAFIRKSDMYNKYCKDQDYNDQYPYIIAIASFDQINYTREYVHPLTALLFGKYYNYKTNKYKDIDSILKPNTTSDVKLGLFDLPDYEHVSGVLYSSTLSLERLIAETKLIVEVTGENLRHSEKEIFCLRYNYDNHKYYGHLAGRKRKGEYFDYEPLLIHDGLYLYINPNAKNPIPKSFYNGINITDVVRNDKGEVMTRASFNELVTLLTFSPKNIKLLSKHFRIQIADYNFQSLPDTTIIDFTKTVVIGLISEVPNQEGDMLKQLLYLPIDIEKATEEKLQLFFDHSTSTKRFKGHLLIRTGEDFEEAKKKYKMLPLREYAYDGDDFKDFKL